MEKFPKTSFSFQLMAFDSYFKDLNSYFLRDGTIPRMTPSVESSIKNFFINNDIQLILITNLKYVEHSGWWYEMDPINEIDLNFYLPLITIELSLYPKSFLSKLCLKQIIICHSIVFHSDMIEQYRPGLADINPGVQAMVYSAKERDINSIRSVIHHELYHYFEYVAFGSYVQIDHEWNLFNPKGFVYGKNVLRFLEKEDSDFFVTEFSKNSIEEDKAEVFSYLVTKGETMYNFKCREGVLGKALIIKKRMELFDPVGFRIGNGDFWEKTREFLFTVVTKYID